MIPAGCRPKQSPPSPPTTLSPPTPPSPLPPLTPEHPTALDALAPARLDTFIARWSAATGSERANYQLFLTELCALLDLPPPEPAREDTQDNAYCFERRVIFQHGDGTQSQGFIDLYRRASFVLPSAPRSWRIASTASPAHGAESS